ncbi:MAG TPA: DUF5695 domain-containing protein [Pyrinomonadaceae bacterium]|nr:DUF5695 domain-containing protein [Pyrinomonadaceae bacterium]
MKQFSRLIIALLFLWLSGFAQNPTPTPSPTLGLENGLIEFETPQFTLKLVKSSQTIAALLPNGGNGFDFTPADWLKKRASNGFYHLGDIRFSVRVKGSGDWKNYSTATQRKPVINLSVTKPDLANSDLTPSLPEDCPIQVFRKWSISNGKLVLNFELKNKTNQLLEIGSLGIPLIFNNIMNDRNLKQSNEICSFSDPYIGKDGGYAQVTRLKGNGAAMVVVPEGNTPLEAYQLLQEPMRPQQTAEGMFEWLVHSKADAETKWKNAQPWNIPTSEILEPNATRKIGLHFLVSNEIRNIEKTLAENNRPVAVGIPGYILPNETEGKLFLKYQSKIKEIEIEPKNALTISQGKSTKNGWQTLSIRGNDWGRVRLSVKYEDGTLQTVHYYLTKSTTKTVADLGNFLFTKQWLENPSDPFKRSPSVISYDRETNKIVDQDNRAWIAGLGDEGGSGSWLAAGMKQFVEPKTDEIAKYERFIDGVLWGGLQYKDGENKYGVRKSLFYYAPDLLPNYEYRKDFNWTTWASWKKDQTESISRGYNYPHVVAAYWAMYRLARNNENLVKNHPWQWYLEQAFQTTKFAFSRKADGKYRVGYVELGLMEGTIFLELLRDLQREGLKDKATEIESLMKERTDVWTKEEYPFGSEMAWDSTGQEEVYAWCKYFGKDDKALVSLNSIIGYMPTIPHWGYNGNARRYWDFLYGGKLRRIERQLHHYGSGLNAIPVLDYYREHPDDFYLLRVGYGGMMGALSNIDQEGFASVAFHSFADTLKWDGYSGDYGPNFFGHAMNSATYIINHPEFGWQSFGGNVQVKGDLVKVIPLDSLRQRIYIAPFGLWLTLDAGRFAEIEINQKTKAVRIGLLSKTLNNNEARLRIEQPAKINGIGKFQPTKTFKFERDAFNIPLDTKVKWIEIKAKI